MQEETTDRWDRPHPPRCTTTRKDRRIVRMAEMDHTATSRTIAQQIQSATHHSVSARTIYAICSRVECPQGVHCFVYSKLKITGICTSNGAMNDGHGQRKRTTLCLLTNPAPASTYNITMVGFELVDTVVKGW
ncbi:hypothetical protein TNCV_3002141 [Trichonephila clavipes]|nr:hypothetical protein TNCV_3002141 [Trichonephila clavipes]